MQGQKGYVNGYVVIIFAHYINCRGDGGMRENVTWASFLEVMVERLNPCRSELAREKLGLAVGCQVAPVIVDNFREQARSYRESWSTSNGSSRSQDA